MKEETKTKKSPLTKTGPFSSDTEYLDTEYAWLGVKATKLSLQNELRDIDKKSIWSAQRASSLEEKHVEEVKKKFPILEEEEKRAREAVDKRIAEHRAVAKAKNTIGLDDICNEYNLEPEERLILLITSVPAISKRLNEDILGSIGGYAQTIGVAEIISILEPEGVAGWLNMRRFFLPSSALVCHGLIDVKHHSQPEFPGDLMVCDVSLTFQALEMMVKDISLNKGCDLEECCEE